MKPTRILRGGVAEYYVARGEKRQAISLSQNCELSSL